MNRSNLIVLVIDSLRQDHVSYYNGGGKAFPGVEACKTPNLDELAKESVTFSNAYPAGLPTIPIRTELMTGHYTLPYRSWEPLHPSDITLAEILKSNGYVTGLIADNYHLFKPGMNFHKGFNSFSWIRGQEYDAFRTAPPKKRNVDDYVNKNYREATSNNLFLGTKTPWIKLIEQYLANVDDFEEEDDWFAARVFEESSSWLRANSNKGNFFLWVDCFDPHEPWFPPIEFNTYTDRNHSGPKLILPMGGMASEWATPEEINYVRGMYAGEAAFVDHSLGRFRETIDELGLGDDTTILVLADHGHPLADHGKFLKGPDRLYNELLKVPFMIRLPGGEHAHKTEAVVQFPDVLPTLLDLLGLGNDTASLHGKSFLPVLTNQSTSHRRFAISGYHGSTDRCIRNERWTYIERPPGQQSELYDLSKDPHERRNVAREEAETVEVMRQAFGSYFRKTQAGGTGVQGKQELGGTSFC